MIIDKTLKHAMLALVDAKYVALHSDEPSEDGSLNELSSANYQRQQCNFSPASNGVRALVDDVTFSLAASDVVRFVSYWGDSGFQLAQRVDDIAYAADGLLFLKAATTIIGVSS